MSNKMSMADLMAKQDLKKISLIRGQEVEGSVIAVLPQELVLDLGTKAEGVLQKKDIPQDLFEKIKVGDKITAQIIQTENENGQVLLSLQKAPIKGTGSTARWSKFDQAKKENKTLSGKALEVNKGGLLVEVNGIRGFLPSSQIALSQASDLDALVGKDLQLSVLEVDPSQNRLIFSQKTDVSEEVKQKLNKLQSGEKVSGVVASVLPFGIFVTLDNGVEGLVHISEISWEKVEDPNSVFKVGDKIEAKVLSSDADTGRANLSIKQLSDDPFVHLAEKYVPDDIVKGTVAKVSSNGIAIQLEDGIEGFIPSSKIDPETNYEVGKSITCLIDSVDSSRRRVNLAPFITSTKDLIYK